MVTLRDRFRLSQILLIVFGTGIVAFGIQCIYDPVGLVTGGFTGLAIVVKNISAPWIHGGIPLWLTNLALNIPVFIAAYISMGKKFIGRTLFATVLLSVWLYIIPSVNIARDDIFLASIFGGVFAGIGMGMVFQAKATTGGTDMLAALIQKKIRHLSVVQVMQFVDGAVVVCGLFVFGIRPTLYAVVAIYITTKVSDSFLEGFKYSKAAFIITDHYEKVAVRIMEELDRGVTGLDAKGMYTHKSKCVLYCVVSKKEIVDVKEIVNEIDPSAFVIVSDVREVLGEGFLEYSKDNGFS